MVPVISPKKRLLCVEDHADTCELISAILTDHEVVSASTAREARQRFVPGAFSLVILDYHLPDGNGLDLCREFRHGDADTPIIFITSDPDISESDAKAAGAQKLIVKNRTNFLDELLSHSEKFSIVS